jgi:sn-glycerol 3-phosphate transport system substrate-binding protein
MEVETMRGKHVVAGILAGLMLFLGTNAMAEKIEINWWHAMRSARGEVCQKLIDDFNKSQDTYVVIGTNKGNYDEVLNAGIAAIRAHKHPHILQSFEVGTQTMMLSGAIYPVYQLMEEAGYTINWDDYLQAVLSYYMNQDGKLMSMPFNSSTAVMYYNADMFKKAGIPLPSKSEPLSWDELGTMLKTMIDKKIAPAGLVAAWQSWTQIENYCAMHNIPFASRANGYEGLDCVLEFNSPQVLGHVTRLKNWMKDNRFLYGGQKYQGPKAEFIAQNAAVYIDSISGIAKLQKAVKDFKWDVAPLPVESWMEKPQNSIIGGASNWVLAGHSPEEYKGVAAFLAFLAQPDQQIYWHKETGYFPITLTAYEKLKKQGYYDEQPYQEVGVKQLNRAIPTKNSRGLRLGYFVQIRNIINEELEKVWNDSKTPQQALDDAVARGNKELRSFEKIYK